MKFHASPGQQPISFRQTLLARSMQHALFGMAVASMSLVPLAFGNLAVAQTVAAPRLHYAIPAGSMESALAAFARTSGVLVAYTPDLVDGVRSSGLSGNYAVDDALQNLLVGSGLTSVATGGGKYTLRRLPSESTSTTLPAVQVSATVPDRATEGTGSYTTGNVSSFKEQALIDVPHSVSVVTRQQIEDQGLTTLTDTLDKTTGLSVNRRGTLSGISHGNDSNFSSRGFNVSNVQVDGGASMDTDMSGFGSVSQLDMAQFDRVEFVRGVDGLYSSTGEPGGTVNLVRKRPTAERKTTVSVSTGSWNNHRIEADMGTPVTEDGRVRTRIGMAHEDRKYFYDVAKNRKTVLYGSVEVDLTPVTLLTVGGSYQKADGTLSVGGLPRYSNGDDLHLPRRTSLTSDWSSSSEEAKQYFATVEHHLNSDWVLSADALYLDIARDANPIYALGAIDPIDLTGARWYSFPADSSMKRATINANVKGAFDAFGQRHDVVVGADYSYARSEGVQWYGSVSGTEFDIFNIVAPTDGGAVLLKDDHRTSRREALYGSVRIGVMDAMKVIVGGRYSSYSFETHNTQWNADGSVARRQNLGTVKTNGIFTPYAGLTYALDQRWNVYASYAETYNPQDAALRGPLPGAPVGPVESKNYEIGIKGELVPGKLNAAAALYRINRTGEAIEDPAYGMQYGIATCCYLNKGRVISQGLGIEVTGEIAQGWQLVAGYTYNQNEDKEETLTRYSSKTPRHLFKLWANHRPSGDWAKWQVGGGVTVQSATYVDGWAATYNPTSQKWDGDEVPFKFSQAGYAIWNARIAYEIEKRWSIALNVNNLFDKTYYQTVGYNYFGNFYGDPRNAMLTLRGRF